MAGLLLLGLLVLPICQSLSTYEAYLHDRNSFFAKDADLSINAAWKLTPAETVVDEYLQSLKDADNNLDPIPVQFNFVSMRPAIDESKLFALLSSMPKGALLHSHDLSSLDMHFYVNATYLPGCLIDPAVGSITFVPNTENHVPIAEVRDSWPEGAAAFDAELYQNFTILQYEDQVDFTGDAMWDLFQGIFDKLHAVYNYLPVFRRFYQYMFPRLWADGVQRWEMRTNLGGVYDEQGREYSKGEAMAVILEELEAWKAQDPEARAAFSFAIIMQGTRSGAVEDVTASLASAFSLREQYPGMVLGFDLVGHEDPGKTLYYWAPILMEAQQNLLSSGNYSEPMPYYFHAGESNRVPVQDNIVDAVLLNTSRIGHGFGIQGYPSLWPRINEQRVLIEACPVSNQLLGLVVDQRNHPVGEMLQHAMQHFTPTDRGAPLPESWQRLVAHDPRVASVLRNNKLAPSLAVSINNDDPGFWGIDVTVSYDWYAAVLGWDLSLGGVKQLAVDSIMGSGASLEQKSATLLLWSEKWDAWITSMQR